jgi:hypothetical protein
MISNVKAVNIKVVFNSSRSTTYILVKYPFDKVLGNFVHKLTYILSSFINYVLRFISLWPMYGDTLTNEYLTKIKVVDIDKFYNFYIDDFVIRDHLVFKNQVRSCSLLKLNI